MHPADEAWIRWYAAYTDRTEEEARAVLNEYKTMVRRFEQTGDPYREPVNG